MRMGSLLPCGEISYKVLEGDLEEFGLDWVDKTESYFCRDNIMILGMTTFAQEPTAMSHQAGRLFGE